MARITVLVENTATGQGLLAEHGVSFWIERNGTRVLFDTGQGYVLGNNAERLNVDLKTADALVLSHGHFDHTGGLAETLEVLAPPVYVHPHAFAPRYACAPGMPARDIGMPGLDEAAVREKTRLVWTEGPTEVAPGLFATGPVPRRTAFEDTGGPFFLDPEGSEPDTFPDDQALYFESRQGTVIVLGCAHAGVINTVEHVRALTGNRPVFMVLGGMHLVAASPERMDQTVEAFRRIGVRHLLAGHCTGFPAMARLWQEFPDQYSPCPTGTVLEIKDE